MLNVLSSFMIMRRNLPWLLSNVYNDKEIERANIQALSALLFGLFHPELSIYEINHIIK